MTDSAVLLALEQSRWRVVCRRGDETIHREVALEPGQSPGQVAGQLRTVLIECGWDGREVVLGLPSDVVFAARINCVAAARKDRRRAMLYSLEEQLPLEAERLTADFLAPIGGQTLGMAVEAEPTAALLADLADEGIDVAAICPTTLLAVWDQCGDSREHFDYAVVPVDDRVDVVHMSDRQPIRWWTSPADAARLSRDIMAGMLADPPTNGCVRVGIIGAIEPELQQALNGRLGLQPAAHGNLDPLTAAARAAGVLLASKPAGWINFRRDQLAATNPWRQVGRLVRSATVLTIVLLMAAAGMLLWRGHQFDRRTATAQTHQRAIYHKLYPSGRAPASVVRRLASEHKRLTGLCATDASLPSRPGALDTLRRIMANLPEETRVRIGVLQIGETSVMVEGQVRAHGDAEAIRRRVNRAGLAMNEPTTRRLGKRGVSFTLIGKPCGDDPGRKEANP